MRERWFSAFTQEQAADREDKELNQGVDRMEVLGLCVHCPLSLL